jgi:hypothetical protein
LKARSRFFEKKRRKKLFYAGSLALVGTTPMAERFLIGDFG